MIDKEEALKKFKDAYKYKISPKISIFEKKRKGTKIFIFSCVAVFIVNFILAVTLPQEQALIPFALCFISIFLAVILGNKIDSDYIRSAKASLLQPILSIFNFTHSLNVFNFKLEEFDTVGLFPNAQYNYEDDALEGIINKTNVYISESKLYHFRGSIGINGFEIEYSGKRKRKGINSKRLETSDKRKYNFDYSGLIIKIAKKNVFNGIFIKQELLDCSQIPSLLRPMFEAINLSFINPRSKLYEKLNLNIIKKDGSKENTIYYTDNKTESEKFFNSQMFQKFEKIQKILSTENLQYAINNQAIYLFIEASPKTKDVYHNDYTNYFEFGDQNYYTSLHNEQIYKNLFSQIYRLTTVIDYLTSEEQKDINEI